MIPPWLRITGYGVLVGVFCYAFNIDPAHVIAAAWSAVQHMHDQSAQTGPLTP